MEAVNAFNMELFSMIEMKPPISRAKMMSVTKSAIKAIKLYKHVVQIVEKFIKKCKPELKVPGLYVVDSIVRQSRHQFGIDKDVFGPRFLKNFTDTFQNLYHCPEDDKNKIIRVLNLWQKNSVFDMDILQPLMDMADGTVVPAPVLEVPGDPQPEMQLPISSASVGSQLPTSDALAAVAQLFQSPHGQELQRMLQKFQQADKTLAATTANSTPNPPQRHLDQLNSYSTCPEKKSSLAEKLLDRFDYDDEPEDVIINEVSAQSQGFPENVLNHFLVQMSRTQTDHQHMMGKTCGIEPGGRLNHSESHMMDGYHSTNEAYLHSQGNSREDSTTRRENRHRGNGRRSRSRSGSRRRSRSSSRSRWSRHRRSHSRSREHRWRSRSGSQDRSERERDRERRQKGFPSLKSQTLSVCSTTLWVGQLDKKTQQSDVMSLLEEFGQIESINMIPPRGCAYIVMVHRQDAFTALNKLSRGSYKVNQKPVKIAWALNKGIKSIHKKFWDVERGVTYIPWSKVKVEELESYREGGMLDPETLSPEWHNATDLKKAAVNGAVASAPADGAVNIHIQFPHVSFETVLQTETVFVGGKSSGDFEEKEPFVTFIDDNNTTIYPCLENNGVMRPHKATVTPTLTGLNLQYSNVYCVPPLSTQQAPPIGSPPAFPGSLMLSPTGMPPGAAPFIPAEFDPAQLAAGSVNAPEEESKRDQGTPVDVGSDQQLGSPVASAMPLPRPAIMQGPRPVMPPLQPPGLNPHLPSFLPPPNMPHMHPQMMPGGPVFPPDRFRMPMPFPAHGSPFHPPAMAPEVMDGMEERHFLNGRPGFGGPPFHRRW